MDDRRASEDSRREPENPGAAEIGAFPFFDRLAKFVEYIGGVRELKFLAYDCPNRLKNRLDENVTELEIVLGELKAAAANADRLRRQKSLVKKEITAAKKTLKIVRDDELREMERVVSLYDKPMFARWEDARITQRPEVLEGILSDIKGKQLALENLHVLVTRRLNRIQTVQPILCIEADKSRPGPREKTAIPLPFPSFCSPPPPPPPPLPPPPPIPASHPPKRSHAQRLSVQRRRRIERRDENPERRCVVTANPEDLSLAPFNFGELPDRFYSAIIGGTSDSGREVASLGETDEPRPPNGENVGGGSRGLGIEFQDEMRNVLQALFGELSSPSTFLHGENGSANAENGNAEREIEFYAMGKQR